MLSVSLTQKVSLFQNFPHVDMITESGNAELNGWHEQFPDMPISTGEVRLEAPSVL